MAPKSRSLLIRYRSTVTWLRSMSARSISTGGLALGYFSIALGWSLTGMAQLALQSAQDANPVILFKTASDLLQKSEHAQAIALFQRVAQLSSGTPLAIEANYYTLIAQRNQISDFPLLGGTSNQAPSNPLEHAPPDRFEELRCGCSEWICVANQWQKTASQEKLEVYQQRLKQRIDSVLVLESQLAYALGNWQETLALLDQLDRIRNSSLDDTQWTALMRLESYVQLQRWQDAEDFIQSITFLSEEKLAQIPPPRSMESFLLRKAEVAMVLGKWDVAHQSVCNIRKHFPECTVSSQVDYVLARCLVHDAKFDEARQLLASVLATQPPPSAPLQIKAWWTIAETYLMQRKFPEAFAAYQRVAEMGANSPWVQLADRQMAICQDAFGDSVAVEVPASNDATLRSTQKQTPKQPR
ncbi:MAG: tetratricopeptide repeat protein [Pirellula sp.]